MKIGFIGTGEITKAVVTGILSSSLNINKIISDKIVINVSNKCDLISNSLNKDKLFVSAKTGEGFPKLLEELKLHLNETFKKQDFAQPFLGRKRHYEIFNDIIVLAKNISEIFLASNND